MQPDKDKEQTYRSMLHEQFKNKPYDWKNSPRSSFRTNIKQNFITAINAAVKYKTQINDREAQTEELDKVITHLITSDTYSKELILESIELLQNHIKERLEVVTSVEVAPKKEQIHTTPAIAKILGTSIQNINNWIKSGKLVAYREVEGEGIWKVKQSDLYKFVALYRSHQLELIERPLASNLFY